MAQRIDSQGRTQLLIWIPVAEKEELRTRAFQSEMNMTDYVRHLLKKEFQQN